jgi:succinylarginine dihydrolase
VKAYEINFDGIIGPTHNYAGLSYGNVASMQNKRAVSHPKQAALQGLAKMKFMADLGLKQAVLPPHERPHLPTLRRVGYCGDDADILARVAKSDPVLLASVSSASAMWAANAATVSPSADTLNERVHFTPANLISHFHRSIETPTTARILRTIFPDERRFVHHDPLPPTPLYSDEGAANHTRLGSTFGRPGIEIFTYGSFPGHEVVIQRKFPARQSKRASFANRMNHWVNRAAFVCQNPSAIDAGAFHNDVVAVGNRNLLLYHEQAWSDARRCLEQLEENVTDLRAIEVKDEQVPLSDAISSYLFNSQLVTLPDGSDALIAPVESRENPRVREFLESLTDIHVHFVDVRQSMRNGGGPACLRLRVALTEAELAATHQGVLFTDELHDQLTRWIERYYPSELSADDLADPKLLDTSRSALDQLTRILQLGSIYEFQM